MSGPLPPNAVPDNSPTSWPRSAQITTASLLLLTASLLAGKWYAATVWNARPSELTSRAISSQKLDLNGADRSQLLQLPGVGPSLAKRIETRRQELGGFENESDLKKVQGVGPATFERLRPLIRVGTNEMQRIELAEPAPIKKPSGKEANLKGPIPINSASLADLQKLPRIGPKMAERIVEERSKKPFRVAEDLRRVRGIGPKTLEQLRPHISFEDGTVTALDIPR